MKKSLIALAVSAAAMSAAQAQNVVIDGFIDRAYVITNSSNNANDQVRIGAASGTDTIGISGSEDLGGGIRAGFRVNTDFSDQSGVNLDSDIAATSYAAGAVRTGGFGNSQMFLSLEIKDVGTIRLGSPNDLMLTAVTSVGQPGFSTTVGSIYSSSFSIHEGLGTGVSATAGLPSVTSKADTTTGYTGTRSIRQRDTVQYVSPSISGFQVGVSHTNSQDKSGTAAAATNDAIGRTEYSLRYTGGPLDLMFVQSKYDVGSVAPANSAAVAGTQYTNRALAAAFSVSSAVRLHAGSYSSKSEGPVTVAINSQATSFGASWNMSPSLALMGQIASLNDKSSFNMDRKLTGLGLNYALSKRTRAYMRYDQIVTDEDNRTTAGNRISRTAAGIAHTF